MSKKVKKSFMMDEEVFKKLKIHSAKTLVPYSLILERLVKKYIIEDTSINK